MQPSSSYTQRLHKTSQFGKSLALYWCRRYAGGPDVELSADVDGLAFAKYKDVQAPDPKIRRKKDQESEKGNAHRSQQLPGSKAADMTASSSSTDSSDPKKRRTSNAANKIGSMARNDESVKRKKKHKRDCYCDIRNARVILSRLALFHQDIVGW